MQASPPRLWFLYLLGPLIATIRTALLVVAYAYMDEPVPWGSLAGDFIGRCLWIPVTPLVIAAARRWPLVPGVWLRNLPRQVLCMLGCISLMNGTYLLSRLTLNTLGIAEPYPFGRMIGYYFQGGVIFEVLIYWAAVSWVMVLDYHQSVLRGELRAARLETEVANARLAALKLQLNPHFLFNTLNSIATLIHTDPDGADAMVVRLGKLLRMSLETGTRHEVPLAHELDLLHAFLAIEKTRFADRLQVQERIEPATLSALVPALVLQPLVENALRHGALARRGRGRVSIEAARHDGRLVVEVLDDGDGPSLTPLSSRGGVGLSNTRARLAALYRDAFCFTAEPLPGSGFRCRLEIPWRVADA